MSCFPIEDCEAISEGEAAAAAVGIDFNPIRGSAGASLLPKSRGRPSSPRWAGRGRPKQLPFKIQTANDVGCSMNVLLEISCATLDPAFHIKN